MTRSATARSSPEGLGTAASSRKRSRTSDTELPGDLDAVAPALTCALERSLHELAEERRRPRRPRLELRMELRRDEPRMVGELDDLHEPAVEVGAADEETGVDEPLAVGVVHLVPVTMPPRDDRPAAGDLAHPRPRRELDRLRAEAHRAARSSTSFCSGSRSITGYGVS